MKPNVESTAYQVKIYSNKKQSYFIVAYIKKLTLLVFFQVTRFYRPPELLLDAVFYSPLIDVWSAGCVLGEMLRGTVLLPGRDSKHQLKLVIEVLGSPDASELLAMRSCTRLDGGMVQPKGFGGVSFFMFLLKSFY